MGRSYRSYKKKKKRCYVYDLVLFLTALNIIENDYLIRNSFRETSEF